MPVIFMKKFKWASERYVFGEINQKKYNPSSANYGLPLIFYGFFASFGPEAVGRAQLAKSTVVLYKKRRRYYTVFLILNIFHQKQTALMPVKKNQMRMRLACFWRRNLKKVQKETSIVQFIFDFGHFSSKAQRSHACFFQKKNHMGMRAVCFQRKKS